MRKRKNDVAGKPGSDPLLPNVTLILGGEERHLVYDFNAIVQAELATGINLLQAAWTDVTAASLRGMLWASLLPENPNLTVEQVGKWITAGNMQVIHAAIIAAWLGSIEQADGGAPGEAKAQVPKNA